MINYEFKDLFLKQDVDKQILIEYDTGQLTNNEIPMDEFSVEESICSEESLVFGTCEASVLKFTCNNVFEELKNKWLNVTTTPKGASKTFQIGKYKVYSDIPTADRKKRNVVAYDALYEVLQTDVSEWYNTLLPNKNSTETLKTFRDSFFSHFGIEQEEIILINDDMVVTKTIQPEELSGKVVINAICEINGCFGHIGRNGKFKYIYLEPIREGLYPSETLYPRESLYPADPNVTKLRTGTYISASYEDYLVEKITKLQIRQEEDDIGKIIGSGDNTYVIQDNFLVYGKLESDLQTIGENILDKIGGIYYRPFTAKAKGNPCLEVGDAISLSTKYIAIHSYILQRTLTGIQALRDEYAAEGSQYQPTQVNSANRSIQQLQGRYNKLTRTVDETRSEIGNLETRTETMFLQTDEKILAEAKRASEAEASLRVTADQIQANVNTVSYDLKNNYLTITETESKISASSNGILLSVSQNYETIANANSTYSSLQGQININAENISLKVSTGEVVSAINVSTEAIKLKGNRLIVESTNFNLDEDGNCSIKGNVDATSGFIGGFELSADGFLINGETILTDHTSYFGAVYTDDINGYVPITSGNINSYLPSTSDFVTESELSTVLGAFVTQTGLDNKLASYPTYAALENVLSQKGYITSSYLDGYATEYWVNTQLSSYATTSQLSNYLTLDAFDYWQNNTLDYKFGDLEDMYNQLEERIYALEAAI